MNVENGISFLVPTLGTRLVELNRLFESLKKQTNRNFDIVVVVQDNYQAVEELCDKQKNNLSIKIVENEERGLSKARNAGFPYCKGSIIIFSDDDCWYPQNTAEFVIAEMKKRETDVLLTKIYDLKNNKEYKKYGREERYITSVFQLMSKSSIEIAVRNSFQNVSFDEDMGLGAKYVCCEEVDYLIRLYRKGVRMVYLPTITVYHEKKYEGSTRNQVVAKGAVYSKYFNAIVGFIVCVKDLLKTHENNFKAFFEGFYGYKKSKRKN